MKIKNSEKYPKSIIRAIETQDRVFKDNRISVTELDYSPKYFWLRRRHYNEVEVDVESRIWLLLGKSVHYILEKSAQANALSEEKLKIELNECTIVGVPDLYEDKTVYDFKITSVWSYLYGSSSYNNWVNQLNVYKYMLNEYGFEVKKLKVIAILRDWSKGRAQREKDYPASQIQIIDIPICENVKLWIKERLCELFKYAKVNDDNIPECDETDRWQSPTQFAVMKKNRKSAIRLLNSYAEAEMYIENNNLHNCYIEKREGEPRRCLEYCDYKEFCNFYRSLMEKSK